jgi:hypothetical protein
MAHTVCNRQEARKMNKIIARMWSRGITVTQWAALNGFKIQYARPIIHGRRGKWNIGEEKRIRETLFKDGFLTEKEYEEVNQ